MIRHSSKQSKSKIPFGLLLFIPIIGVLLYYFFITPAYLPKDRISVVFLTDPIEVASFDPTGQQWTRVQFPASTHIAGIQGLGQYAVDSLWNIAATEGSPSAVVLGSITDELGVPTEYYVGIHGSIWEKEKLETNVTGMHFGFTGVLRYLLHQVDTNIPIPLYIALTKSFTSTEEHLIHTEFLEKGNGLEEKKLPDNSTILEFNRDQFDTMTADIFEDHEIRDERIRVSVINTTGAPFLGGRVARILDRIGANIIQVGNEDQPITQCELSGVKEKLQSKTAKTIEQLFNCKEQIVNEVGRADLTVRVGTVYVQRFLPKQK